MQFDQIPPTTVKRIVHSGTQFEQVKAALIEAGANTENAKREVEYTFGGNTNVVFCEYDDEQYRAYVPFMRYLAKTQQIRDHNRMIADVVQFVDHYISEPARDNVTDDGDDTTVTLTLDQINTLHRLLGMDEVRPEREYKVTVNATATYYVTVTAGSEEDAADEAYYLIESDFDSAADMSHTDGAFFDGSSIDVLEVSEA